MTLKSESNRGWPAASRRLSGKSLRSSSPSFRRLVLLVLLSVGRLPAQTTPAVDPAIALPKFEVQEHAADEAYDATGLGSHEEELRSAPFANELTMVDIDAEEGLSLETAGELSAISTTSPAAVAAGGHQRRRARGAGQYGVEFRPAVRREHAGAG